MTTTRMSLFAAAIGSLLLGGCSLFPGMSFDGSTPSEEAWAGHVDHYRIVAITPRLLLAETQALARRQHHLGRANPVLDRQIADYRYLVEPRDVLSIVVWGDPTKTSVFTPMAAPGTSLATSPAAAGFKVSPDGTIYFPYAGRVAVAGQTTEQIRAALAHLMEPFIQDPQVTVAVAEFNSQKYQLAGVVAKPGLYPITDMPLTVSEAISSAGGIVRQMQGTGSANNLIARPLGDLSRVLYIHDQSVAVLDLRALEAYGDRSQDRLIQPGDVIQVPDNSFEQVHLIGEVRNPGNYPLSADRLNLSQLLGDAGGVDPTTANPERIFVFRGAYQEPQIFWLDASSPDAMLLANDFQLEPQDVVYVATAGLVSWNRIVSQILPTVQTLYFSKVFTQ